MKTYYFIPKKSQDICFIAYFSKFITQIVYIYKYLFCYK